jgi:hypothetical protein
MHPDIKIPGKITEVLSKIRYIGIKTTIDKTVITFYSCYFMQAMCALIQTIFIDSFFKRYALQCSICTVTPAMIITWRELRYRWSTARRTF